MLLEAQFKIWKRINVGSGDVQQRLKLFKYMGDNGQCIKIIYSVDHQLSIIICSKDLIFNGIAEISASSIQVVKQDNSSLVSYNLVGIGVTYFVMEGTPLTNSFGIR